MGEDERNWRATFETLGEHEVRRRLGPAAIDRWADAVNQYAGRWLDHLAKDAAARQHAALAEQTEVQRKAAEAGEGAVAEARKANSLALEANEVARDAAASAREATSIARDSNSIALDSNELARTANEFAREANSVARDSNENAIAANAFASKANRRATDANKIAIAAAVIAALAAIASIISPFLKGG